MRARQLIYFSMRQLRREWRAGELSVLVLALVVGIASHTAINHFTTRISAAMASGANDVIGGDLALSGAQKAAAEWLDKAAELGLASAHTTQFSSVIVAGDEILLVGAKAVDDGYPLKGSLKLASELYGATHAVRAAPPPGEAWVEARVMRALNLAPGDSFELGQARLVASRILAFEPDRGRNFYSLAPRVLLNARDLERTGVVQPASRVWRRYLFAGAADKIAQYRAWLEPRLPPGQRLRGLDEERPAVAAAVHRAQQYMGLASLVALLLAAVAIASSGRHYSERHYDTSAMLRCLGCRQRDLVAIYMLQLLALALLGGALGGALGWLAQAGLLGLISGLLPANIPPPGWAVFISGMALAGVVLIGFTLPSVLRLKSVPPLRALRRDLTPRPLSAWLVYGGGGALTATIMGYYSGNLTLTLGLLGGVSAALASAAGGLYRLFKWLDKRLPSLPLKIRAGVRNLLRRRRAASTQTMAFGLTIMAMLIVVFIRTELLDAWAAAIPDDAPNHFTLNIQPHENAAYTDYLAAAGIPSGRLYPVVRGRLTHINERAVARRVSKEPAADEAQAAAEAASLRRALNLTWADTLPPDNEIIAGAWWSAAAGNAAAPLVSVESELAEQLGIQLGDSLTFATGEQAWQAQVGSLRRVKWDNFQPNFYMVFNPQARPERPERWITDMPSTSINSFRLQAAAKHKLTDLVRHFPAITVLEVDSIIEQVRRIIGQATLAIEAILGFVLAASAMVTLAAIRASMHERMREAALLRALGADRALLRRSQWGEFATLGLLSGLFGVLGAEIVNALLYQRVFDLAYAPAWWAWALIPPLSAACIGAAGVAASGRVLRQNPAESLRQWR